VIDTPGNQGFPQAAKIPKEGKELGKNKTWATNKYKNTCVRRKDLLSMWKKGNR
jgi:hypothetical protein